MNQIDLIIDALLVAESSVWSDKIAEALVAARELKAETQWVGLTDEEIYEIIDVCAPDEAEQDEINDFARAVCFVEAKLKEKNT